MKKILSLIIAIIICLTFTNITSGEISNIIQIKIIDWLSNGKGTIKSDEYVTKGELVQVLTKFADETNQEKQITGTIAKAMAFTVKIVVDGSMTMVYPAKDGKPMGWITKYGQFTGTGVFISPKRLITNNHVVEDRSPDINDIVDIETVSGEKYKAKILSVDKINDLALLEVIADRTFQYVEIAEKVTAGETALIIGNTSLDGLNLNFSVTKGIVSNPYANADFNKKQLQVDASINNGFSGGGILNIKGELIGISYKAANPDKMENVGFGVNVEYVHKIINSTK